MTHDDVLFGYRLQLFDLAGRTGVAEACRIFGVHRSTYYRWKAQVDRHGLEMLRPRERRKPRMPNQLSPMVEQRIVAFALAHPGMGPRRVASELARPKWGGLEVSHNGVWRVLRRHGLNTRSKRLSLVAGYRSPYEPPREAPAPRHINVKHPGDLVGIDCFFVGRLQGVRGAVWQITAIDVRSSYAWADLITCPAGQPTVKDTSRLAQRVARDLSCAGWKLERFICDNGNEFRGDVFHAAAIKCGARITHIKPGRPQSNGHVEALHRTILDECWRPSFARHHYVRFHGLKADLADYLDYYNHDRAHNGRLTKGAIPADIVDPARKMHTR